MNKAGGSVATGIDIGSDTIRVVQIRCSGHSFSIIKAASASLEDLGTLDESKRKDARIAMVLRNVMKESRIRPVGAITNVPPGRVLLKYTQIPPVPSWKLNMLMKYEIDAETTDRQGCVAADFRLLDLPIISDRYTVLMSMVQKEAVESRMDIMAEAAVKPMDITISAVGLYESFVHCADVSREGVSLLVSIGANSTDLIFVGGRKFYFARSIARGGRAFSKAVSEDLDISFQEAEERKRSGILSVSEIEEPPTEDDKVSNSLLGAADKLASDIHSAILFCRAQTHMVDLDVSRIVLLGAGGMLAGLDEALSSRLEIGVEQWPGLEELDVAGLGEASRSDLEENLPAYAEAIGLALAGLKEEAFFLSVFPEEIKARRRFFEKDIFLWYAAALFVAAIALVTFSVFSAKYRRAGYLDKQKACLQRAEEENSDLEELVSENRMRAARAAALEERVSFGRRMLRALAALKSSTPEEVRLLGLETMAEQMATETSREPYDMSRWLYVKGLVKAPKTPSAGEEILRGYTEALRAMPEFRDARILPTYGYKNDQVYFEMRIDLEA